MTEALPTKWGYPYPTNRYYQMNKGTCWAFGTLGYLEHTYRKNGIEKGFLKENEFVRFNEQAYGLSMIDACAKHPSVCNTPGDDVIHNSTEGGEINWLYSFPFLYNSILPSSVCPYTPEVEDQHVCEGMEEAIKTNPLSFTIDRMDSAYTIEQTKEMLVEHQVPIGYGSLIHDTRYYFPCNNEYTMFCNSSLYEIVDCPPEKQYIAEKCSYIVMPMYAPDGEFNMEGTVEPEGGHAMVTMGYNDEFVTHEGCKGGFILKNSWNDTVYGPSIGKSARGVRGSHSVKYYLQELTNEEERAVCPNAQNPTNWYVCDDSCVKNKDLHKTIIEELHQPYLLQCFNDEVNLCESGFDYYLKELVAVSEDPTNHYYKLSVNKYNGETLVDTLTYPPLPLSIIGMIFTPTDDEFKQLPDSEEFCGHYFFPYCILDNHYRFWGGYVGTYFNIEWDDRSYLVNKDKYKDTNLDYSFIESSTFTQ